MALTEAQVEMLGERLVPLFQQLERDVINDIARRLVKTGRYTETAEIMAEAMSLQGYSPSAIRFKVMKLINADAALQRRIESDTIDYKKELAAKIAAMREELQREEEGLWEEAGNLAFHEDLSIWQGEAKPIRDSAFNRLVDEMRKRSTDEMINLTKSAAFRTPDGAAVRARELYTAELNRALVKLTSGTFSWQQCVQDAIREMAKSGLRTADFGKGVSRQIDTAVRTAVWTASTQLAGQISMNNARTGNAEYVEVSAHWGARTGEGHANHAGWQGKVYKLDGSEPGYENLEEATGYPSDPKGLCGYNCRHGFKAFWPGESEPTEWPPEPAPVTVDGKTYTYYEATQEQRRREREIRALKREESALKAAGLSGQAKETRALIRQKTAEYKDFSREVGIREKNERLRVCEVGAGQNIIVASGYKPLTGHDYDANIDIDVPKDVKRLVDNTSKRVTKDFPLLDMYLHAVGYGKNEPGNPATAEIPIVDGYAGRVLSLNRDMWTSVKAMDEFVQEQARKGLHIQAKHADAVITHEYGHLIHDSCALRMAGYIGIGRMTNEQISIYVYQKKRIADEIVEKLKKSGLIMLDGQRAKDSRFELIAEAISDYYSGLRTETSKAVIKYFKEKFK